MPRGGARKNAGRKPGDAWTSPKPRAVREAARTVVRRALEGRDNPIEILLSIAANEAVSVDTRVVAAAHAAPYMFPRLSASVVATTQTPAKGVDVVALMTRLSDRIARLKPPPATIEGEATEAEVAA